MKRVLSIVAGALIFTIIGQFIVILVGISATGAASVINLVLLIAGALVGNRVYDMGGSSVVAMGYCG